MTLRERSDLVLAFARLLHVDGQSTHKTILEAEWLSRRLGLEATIIPAWNEVALQAADAISCEISNSQLCLFLFVQRLNTCDLAEVG